MQPDFTNLNSKEKLVLKKYLEVMDGFCWSPDIRIDGMTSQQIGGYLSQLEQKGYIWMLIPRVNGQLEKNAQIMPHEWLDDLLNDDRQAVLNNPVLNQDT